MFPILSVNSNFVRKFQFLSIKATVNGAVPEVKYAEKATTGFAWDGLLTLIYPVFKSKRNT